MKGLILNKGESYYSSFAKLFEEVEQLSRDFNWLISNAECYPQKLEYVEKLKMPYTWITGEELLQILCLDEFQWIWGVLSGFNKNVKLSEILKYELPYADGYTSFWKSPLTMQHPLAEVEIVAFDSSCSLFISKSHKIIERIAAVYSQAEDLEQYNKNNI